MVRACHLISFSPSSFLPAAIAVIAVIAVIVVVAVVSVAVVRGVIIRRFNPVVVGP